MVSSLRSQTSQILQIKVYRMLAPRLLMLEPLPGEGGVMSLGEIQTYVVHMGGTPRPGRNKYQASEVQP